VKDGLLTCVLPPFSPRSQSSASTDGARWQQEVGNGGHPPIESRTDKKGYSKADRSIFFEVKKNNKDRKKT